MSEWRPTQRAWVEIGVAVVLGVVSVVVFLFGVRDFRRALAVREAYQAYFRSAIPGEGGLAVVSEGLDRAPDDLALLRMKGDMYAIRPSDARGAADVFTAMKKLEGPDPDGHPRAAWGRLGLGLVALEQARRPAISPAEREAVLKTAEDELEAARKGLGRRADANALLGAYWLERGNGKLADESLDLAEKVTEGSTLGALVTLHVTRAEGCRRRGEFDREVVELERALLLAPARPELRERLTRAVGRRTADARLSGDDAKKAIQDAQRLSLPMEPLEHHRTGTLYAFDARQLRTIKEAIAVAEAQQAGYNDARGTLMEALREAPTDRALLRQLAAVYAQLFKAEKNEQQRRNFARLATDTLRDCAQAKDVEPKEAFELFLAAATFARHSGDLEQAVLLLDRAAKIAPEDIRVDRAYGIFFDVWNRPKQAVDAYRKAIARAPADPVSLEMEERMRFLESQKR